VAAATPATAPKNASSEFDNLLNELGL
jgi:hypothetical protein